MALGRIRARMGKALLGMMSVLMPTLSTPAEAGQAGPTTAAKMAANQAGPNQPNQPSAPVIADRLAEVIATSGRATVTKQPDALRTDLGVEVRARLLTQARDELAARIEQLTQAIQALGRQNLSLQTSDLSITPLYDEPAEGQPSKIVGYRARNTLSITLREVPPALLGAEAAAIIDAGVDAGANIVEGLSFFLSRPEQAQALALQLAVEEAERNAKIMAQAANVQITSLHDLNGIPERPNPLHFGESFALRATTIIEPGEVSITATVTARYHFTKK